MATATNYLDKIFSQLEPDIQKDVESVESEYILPMQNGLEDIQKETKTSLTDLQRQLKQTLLEVKKLGKIDFILNNIIYITI